PRRYQFHRDFWALRDVSFDIRRGETFCFVGQNGSGKSTLLQMVAGILQPTSGTVQVNGRVSALLELGAGFNPEFSGRDNVYLNASILGLTKRQIDERYSEITGFAEIGNFLAAMTEKDSTYLRNKSGGPRPAVRDAHRAPEVVESIPNIDHRFGDGRAEIIGIAVYDEQSRPTHLLEPNSRVLVRISVR